MKNHAGAFIKAGGLALPATGATPPGGTTPTPPPSPAPSVTAFDFESNVQGWTRWGTATSVSTSTARAFTGSRSLEVKLAGTSNGVGKAFVTAASVPAGKTVSFHVWIPGGSRITAIQPYLLQGASGGWRWSGAWVGISSLKTGAWNTLTLPVPSNAVSPLAELGLEIFTDATWTGSLSVDSVSW